jgi:hypothetical protein
MLITPLCVHSSFLLKVIVLSINGDYPIVCPFVFMDNTIALSKNDEWTHNGVISIGGQHNNLK